MCGSAVGVGGGDREVRREDKGKEKSVWIHQEDQTLRLKTEAAVHSSLCLHSKATSCFNSLSGD